MIIERSIVNTVRITPANVISPPPAIPRFPAIHLPPRPPGIPLVPVIPPVAAPKGNKRTAADVDREEVEQQDHEEAIEAEANFMDIEENIEDNVSDNESSENDPGHQNADPITKTRSARKKTWWLFVDHGENGQVICLCGCLASDNSKPLIYSGQNTGVVKRHVKLKHLYLHDEFLRCKNGDGNFNRLMETVETLNKNALEKLRVKKLKNDRFFSRFLDDGMEKLLKANLKLMMWAVANGIPRIALNDPLFDSYLNDLGTPAAPNRHSLQEDYLPQLDALVVKEIKDELKNVSSVSLSADGYRDRVRRDWVNVTIYWIVSEFRTLIDRKKEDETSGCADWNICRNGILVNHK